MRLELEEQIDDVDEKQNLEILVSLAGLGDSCGALTILVPRLTLRD